RAANAARRSRPRNGARSAEPEPSLSSAVTVLSMATAVWAARRASFVAFAPGASLAKALTAGPSRLAAVAAPTPPPEQAMKGSLRLALLVLSTLSLPAMAGATISRTETEVATPPTEQSWPGGPVSLPIGRNHLAYEIVNA